MLWFYVSGIAILTGAELNAEIEHASPYGKAPGRRTRKERSDRRSGGTSVSERQPSGEPLPVTPAPSTRRHRRSPALGAAVAGAILMARWWNRRGDAGKRTEAARTS